MKQYEMAFNRGQSGGLAFAMSRGRRRIASLILAQKLVLFALVFLFPRLFPMLFSAGVSVTRNLSAWDIEPYLYIAGHGYEPGKAFCAFYPLWPASIRLGTCLGGGNALLAGYLLANFFSFIALVLFHIFVSERHGLALANRATLLLLFYPGSMFLLVPYSESLFLLLLMICLLSLDRGIILGAALAGFFLALTRAIGVFVLPLIVWELLTKGARLKHYLICLGPALGYLCYLGIMYYYTKNPFEGFYAQLQYPAQPSISRTFDLPGFVQSFMDVHWSHNALHSFIDRAVFVAFLISLYWIFRLDAGYYIYAFFAGLIPAMSNIFMSYTRFAVLVFPLFIVWARMARKIQTFPFVLMLFFALQILFLLLFMSGRWAG